MHTHILGYPRIGAQRQLKFALEHYWQGTSTESQLQMVASTLCQQNFIQQAEYLSQVTVGDFALYDQMLNHLRWLSASPSRFTASGNVLKDYFAWARGSSDQPALEMTKWWDTNYHYLVPELDSSLSFEGDVADYIRSISAALLHNASIKPVLIGPVTFLYLSRNVEKNTGANQDCLEYLQALLPAYARILQALKQLNIDWVQIDEPVLTLQLDMRWQQALQQAYVYLAPYSPKILLTTYFDSVSEHKDLIVNLPVQGLHIDLVRAPEQLTIWQQQVPESWVLSAGVVDGRNIWRTDLREQLNRLKPLAQQLGERLWLASSCSLMHVPHTLKNEPQLSTELKSWLAFADEKIYELAILAKGLTQGADAICTELTACDAALHSKKSSVADAQVAARLASLTPQMTQRLSTFAQRKTVQSHYWDLPILPTTTIGSFPQTAAIRQARRGYKDGSLPEKAYQQAMQTEIAQAIAKQTAYGLDVLVHGEAERTDMVEYFGEQLEGFALTANGWVQSYGSRCVKPPIIFADVSRSKPMTIAWTCYAQSLTKQPVKGMLTGPITILQWSFVRNDQARATTALQIALALRDEVQDLQDAGIGIIQIDEPALREGLPLKQRDWADYLNWAVRAFKVASSGVKDTTQIHTHMCYAEFDDILPAITALDADVITLETSRSAMQLLQSFAEFDYPNDVGPGVYDIHSPRVPSVTEISALLKQALKVVPRDRLWVNPDCGLKTRIWQEVDQSLINMVQSAKQLREEWV